MLFDHQQRYLNTLPEDSRVARIVPFDPRTQVVAKEIIGNIVEVMKGSTIYYQGSTALSIAGENDIDLTVIYQDFNEAVKRLTELFGPPKQVNKESEHAHWDFIHDGFQVDMGLQKEMTPMLEEQLKTQSILETSQDLRLEYERMKFESNGLPWKEYLVRKYEFWNKLLP